MTRRPAALQPQIRFGLGSLTRFLEHLHRGFVHLDQIMGQQLVPQQVDQRLYQLTRLDHPVRQRGAGDVDADALQDGLLAIERQSILVLGDGNVGQQAR